MRFASTLTAASFALLAAFALSGCLALAVPSLAYQGYKYEKDKKQEQQASSQGSKSKNSNSSDQYYDTE